MSGTYARSRLQRRINCIALVPPFCQHETCPPSGIVLLRGLAINIPRFLLQTSIL